MQFTEDAMPGIVDGTTTVTFRGWKRAQAKVGGRHRIWDELIEVDDIRTIDAADITEADARRAGAPSRQAVLDRLRGRADGPIWRIEFHHVGPDDRIARRSAVSLDADERAAIQQRLDRMDRSGKTGPWTTKTLRLIGTYPGMVSTALARRLGHERPAFKLNVRKLKELGLTESLEVGYRLSPLGEAFTSLLPDPPPEDEPQ